MQGEIIKVSKEGNAAKLTALLYDSPAVLDRVVSLAGKDVSITISVPKEKRSLDSNNYLWALIRKIAEKQHRTIEEVYFDLLRDYGQSVVITVKTGYDISRAGFKYYELLKEGLLNGKPFTAWKVFIGSSQYNKDEMHILIEGAIKECKELGIDTDLIQLEQYVDLMA